MKLIIYKIKNELNMNLIENIKNLIIESKREDMLNEDRYVKLLNNKLFIERRKIWFD